MLAEHCLLSPGLSLFRWILRGFAINPVSASYCLAAISPGRNALGLYYLSFDMKSAYKKVVTGIFQILKDRARVLAHEDCMRRIVVDTELISDARPFADPV